MRAGRTVPRRHVVLVGLSGAGKTTVGQLVATALGAPFVDLDSEVERRAGRPIARIFAEEGEAAFRALESRCAAEVLNGPPSVVAAGGGLPEDPANRELMQRAGVVVYLRVAPEEGARRLAAASDRPLLSGADRVADLTRLLARREAAYLTAAQAVPTDGRPAEAVAESVASLARDHAHW